MLWLWVQIGGCGRGGMAVNGSGWAMMRKIYPFQRSWLTANVVETSYAMSYFA